MPTDPELIRRIHGGDSAAVAELYERYAPLVWRFVYARIGRDTHAAQDVLSETFLAAMRSLKKGTEPDNVVGWLTGIARHKAVDWHRQRSLVSVSDAGASPQPTPSATDRVADVLDALPEEERVVLEWKYLDRCTVREIAQRLGRSEKAIEAVLYRARQAFRTHYHNAREEAE